MSLKASTYVSNEDAYHVLFIDKDRDIFNAIRGENQNRYIFQYASNGKTAFRWLEQKRFVIIVLNYVFDDKDVLSLIKSLKKAYCHIPIIVLTDHDDIEIFKKAVSYEYGPFRVLVMSADCVSKIFRIMEQSIQHGGRRYATKVLNSYSKYNKQWESDSLDRHEIRNERIKEIENKIKERPGFWTCKGLSERFGVKPQQICKDIKELKSRGFEIEKRPQGGYFFKEDEISINQHG